MNQTIAFITNIVTGIFSNIGGSATAPERIVHDAVYVEETNVSIQPQVMAGATLILIVVLIVIARK